MKPEVHEYQSRTDPDRMCVLVEADTENECQLLVTEIMEAKGAATFLLPVKTAAGTFASFGAYDKQ